jgi:hypothetical protein
MKVVYNKDFILDNIKKVVEQATSFHFIEAKEWYPKANQEAERMSKEYNVDKTIVCGLISVLSPMKGWMDNLKISEEFIKGKRNGHFTTQIKKAKNILKLKYDYFPGVRKQKIEAILNGRKTVNFFNNIYNPLNNNYLTIDRHVLNVCYGGMIKSVTNKQYDFLKNILIEQAKLHNLASSEYQSLLWLMMKYVKKK